MHVSCARTAMHVASALQVGDLQEANEAVEGAGTLQVERDALGVLGLYDKAHVPLFGGPCMHRCKCACVSSGGKGV